jgi:chromate transporter
LAENRRLAASLAAVTATVVGVIANLALWFGLHVLFSATTILRVGPAALELPLPSSLQPAALALAAVASLLLFWLGQSVPRTLAVCAMAGLALKLL